MLVTRANITGLIDRMERDGLVVREADTKDRRVYRARLTAKASNLLDDILPIHADFTRRLMSVLSVPEKNKLTELLQKLRLKMEKI
jgi:MarR family 2-MHQ and catechol resistance regulon transcriptional repressor